MEQEFLREKDLPTKSKTCPSCQGQGQYTCNHDSDERGAYKSWANCPRCHGQGTIRCQRCDGRGQID